MRILIPGATGMLGTEVACEAEALGHEVAAVERGHWDVRFMEQCEYWVRTTQPDVVINCTGIIPDRLDHEVPEMEMVEVNALAPHFLAAACRLHDAHFVQVSTDCVFDGQARYTRPWLPRDIPNARDVYGRSKALGELAAAEVTTVVRTSFIGPQHGLWPWYLSQTKAVEGWQEAKWSGHTVDVVARELVLLSEGLVDGTQNPTMIFQMATERPTTKGLVLHMLQRAFGGPEIEDVLFPKINRWLMPNWELPPLTTADIERTAAR